MFEDKNYKFEVSVSDDAYINKEISGAMIGSGRNVDNRNIRVKYGFKANKGIGYRRIVTTPVDLENKIVTGHVMCNLFRDEFVDKEGKLIDQKRKDGTFGSFVKRDINFDGSYTIGVDIDETGYPSVSAFIEKLTIKPTFYYTSYSHLQPEKGVRFRLVYVFSDLIKYPINFRYAATCLNRIIEKDTGEKIKDDCNRRCSQYFNGTNINNPDVNVEHGSTNYIYQLSDIGYSLEGFYQFLCNEAEYKSPNKKLKEYINRIKYVVYQLIQQHNNTIINGTITSTINDNSNTISNNNNSTQQDNQYTINQCWQNQGQLDSVEEKVIVDYSAFDLGDMNFDDEPEPEFNTLLTWYYINRPDCLMVKFDKDYHFFYRNYTDWSEGENYKEVGDDYFAMYWYKEKLKDGQKRGKTIKERIALRRLQKPDITPDELLYNAMIDVIMFIDNSDNKFNADHLKREVINVLKMEIEDIETLYKGTLDYLKRVKQPKLGAIYKNKDVIQVAHFEMIDKYYNPQLSVSENFKLNSKFSIRTLYRYCKNRGIQATKKVSDDELAQLVDIKESIRWNVQNLKDSYSIKVGKDRVSRTIQQLQLRENTIINSSTTGTINDSNITSNSKYNSIQEQEEVNIYTINQCWQNQGQFNTTIENEVKSVPEIEKTQSETPQILNSENSFYFELPNFYNTTNTMKEITLEQTIENIKSFSTIPTTEKKELVIETPKYDASAFLSGANFGYKTWN